MEKDSAKNVTTSAEHQLLSEEDMARLVDKIKNHAQYSQTEQVNLIKRFCLDTCVRACSNPQTPKKDIPFLKSLIDTIRDNPEVINIVITNNQINFRIPLAVENPVEKCGKLRIEHKTIEVDEITFCNIL